MKQRLESIQTHIDGKTLRERAIMFLTLLGLLWFVWYQALMSPLDRANRLDVAKTEQLRQELAGLDQDMHTILQRSNIDPNAPIREEQDRLQRHLNTLDAKIGDTVKNLIAPNQMAKVLEQVLLRNENLRLIAITSIAPQPLIDPQAFASSQDGSTADKTTDTETAATVNIYRHGVRLEFQGSYLNALAYLQQLQSLPWTLYWDSVEISMESYPQARIAVEVHTLSLEQGWIGV